MYRAIIFCAVFILSLSGALGLGCSSVNGCDCGSVCVNDLTSLPCFEGSPCTCKPGCYAYDKFLEPSPELVPVYGNQCSCPDPVQSEGLPVCTGLPPVNPPEGYEPVIYNDNCGFQQPIQ